MNRKRILILRPDNIGDVVLFTGALRHIRNLYPDGHITLAVQVHIVNLVELCPYIDDCVPVGHLTWRERYQHLVPTLFKYRMGLLIRKLNRVRNFISRPFDTIIYPVKSPQIPHLEIIAFQNPRQTYGITGCYLNTPDNAYPEEFQPRKVFINSLDVSEKDPWVHELITTFDFLRYIGCNVTKIEDVAPQFWLSSTEKNHLNRTQKKGKKIIGLFPGASVNGRVWDTGNYAELAQLLGGQTIYVLFGAHSDKQRSDQVALALREACQDDQVLNLTGQTTLRELARAISDCDLFISMETSGLHMAITSGVPTIGIIGGGHYGRFAPWGDKEKNVFLCRKLECFCCNWRCTQEQIECIQGVTPLEVANAAKQFLKD